MKIEIYKEQDIPMFSVDGELFAYDDYALNNLALMLIDNKYELKNSCTLNDKFTSTRFEELEIDLSEVELIVEE